jgi:hypothetical protein
VKRLLREPLLQFLILGAMLFGLDALFTKETPVAPAKIVVTAAQIDNLAQAFAKIWQRQPSAEEFRGLVEDHVRDEVYYREGKAIGVDGDDIVIRRRIRQKMEFFAEDVAASAPTDGELQTYLSAHPEKFRAAPTVSFRQVFLSASRERSLDADAAKVAEALARPNADPETIGDGFLLGSDFARRSGSSIISDFGQRFADRLFAVPEKTWQGPFVSPFGLHFVFVTERSDGTVRPLAEVRDAVAREWANARRLEKLEEFYRSLRARYEVVVESPPGGSPPSEVAGAAP